MTMKNLKKLMTRTVLISLISSSCFAQEPYYPSPTCDDTLTACDKALRDVVNVNQLQDAIIQDMAKRHYLMEQQNSELKSEVASWWRNPWIMGALGFAAGAVTMGVIKK